ncbi:insulinase family protein [Halomonas sp. 18H]|uniref:insulinase family protein n=1 Tax=Halomonas almeriensis TaxID=308163 RepID=UPI00222F1748|nr:MULTISPECIES: insulinase family protein [Halomonas]MCW4152528.1 insulinase family protein [Halomonas sp. 18H]MDN3553896.1 insulinase family protein [Halomonas almeriensis]
MIPSLRSCLTATLAVTLLLPGIGAAQSTPDQEANDVMTPRVSPHDDRDYRVVTLDNGLQALLISDNEADKAAASVNVGVGNAQDPEDLPGLAHYLEHMLFLGTERYPETDAYQSFLSRHGGQHNAFTAPRDTNYFFSIEPDALSGALDRFSRFFVSPLFNAEKLESERKVVHSEYIARKRNEARRRNDVLDQLLNPAHPATGFSVGSLETLADRPEGEPGLRERVQAFYRQHYDANVMHLAVVAPKPLDELEALVREDFSDVPDRDLKRPLIDTPLVDASRLPLAAELASLRDSRQLSFYFPVPDPITAYRHKPASYLTNLLGHEGEGSLLSVLRDAGWADGLVASIGRRDGRSALLKIDISLTPEGTKHRQRIQATLFEAIRAIRDNGVEAWRYDEQAELAEQSFRFPQHGSALDDAMRLSMNLSRYPVEDVNYAPYRMDGFDADMIDTWLSALRPDNMLRLYSGPEVKGEQTSPWFDTPWTPVALDDASQGSRDAEATPLSGLSLPGRNSYIAEDFTLLGVQDDKPRQRIDEPAFSFWQMRDASFDTPKVEWRFSLQHPASSQNARDAALSRLLAGWLQDSLNEALYPARLAGHGFEAYAHARGITLSFSGWRDGQRQLIERVLEQLDNGEIRADSVERVRERLRRGWRNAPQNDLYQQARRTLAEALIRPQWSPEALLNASEDLDTQALQDFRERFLGELHIESMAIGDISHDLAAQHARTVAETLAPQLDREATPPLITLNVNEGLPTLVPDSQRPESLALRYLQGARQSLDTQARLAVLGRLLATPFYQQLRTEQQLGYIVTAGYSPLLQAPGISFLVQSPDTDSQTLQARIDDFMKGFAKRLESLEESDLAPYRQAVRDNLQQRDTSLAQRTNRLWRALALEDTDFDHRQRLAERVMNVSPAALRDAWQQLMQDPALNIAHDPKDAASDVMTLKTDLAPLPSPAE